MQAVLQDFHASITRIRDVADDITSEASMALGNPSVLRRHETIQFASTVILSGYFESFLRGLARAYIRDVSRLAIPFQALPNIVRHSHFEHGGQVLTSVARAEKKGEIPRFSTSTADLAARLHSVWESPYNLVWEAFADTGANPGPSVVKDYLGRMGVKEVWPSIGRKTATGAPHRTETWIIARLTSFIAVRNECAHAGGSSVNVLPSNLRDYCELFETLSSAMVGVLADTCRTMTASPPARLPPPR